MDMSDGRGTTHKDPIDNFVCVGISIVGSSSYSGKAYSFALRLTTVKTI